MKTFAQFCAICEDIDARRQQAKERASQQMQKHKDQVSAHKSADEEERRRQQDREELKREIKQELTTEVYDKGVMGSSQIRKTGEGGRIGAERKKTAPEKRRMKAVGGGKFVPAKDYKPRKDIGQQRQTSTRQSQPEKERGSAEVKQSYADKVKAERRAAAQARIAAKKGKAPAPEKKKTPTASELLAKKKKTEVSPTYTPQKASGYSRDERRKIKRAGQRLVRDIQKGVDKPASHYDPNK